MSPIFDSGVTLGKAAAQRLARLREAELGRCRTSNMDACLGSAAAGVSMTV